MCEVNGGHCVQDQINFIIIGDHKKLWPWVGHCNIDRGGNLKKPLAAIVWQLKTMAKNLRPRRSLNNTVNAKTKFKTWP